MFPLHYHSLKGKEQNMIWLLCFIAVWTNCQWEGVEGPTEPDQAAITVHSLYMVIRSRTDRVDVKYMDWKEGNPALYHSMLKAL